MDDQKNKQAESFEKTIDGLCSALTLSAGELAGRIGDLNTTLTRLVNVLERQDLEKD